MQAIARTIEAMPQFDEQQPFGPQLAALLAQIDLIPAQWQSEPLLVVLMKWPKSWICKGYAKQRVKHAKEG